MQGWGRRKACFGARKVCCLIGGFGSQQGLGGKESKDEENGVLGGGSFLAPVISFLAGLSIACLACCLDDPSGNHFIPGSPGLK